MQNIFSIITYEKEQKKGVSVGCSVFGLDDIYYKYLPFVKFWNLSKKKLYFATVDIKNCFDTINQQTLFQFLNDNLFSNGFFYIFILFTYLFIVLLMIIINTKNKILKLKENIKNLINKINEENLKI